LVSFILGSRVVGGSFETIAALADVLFHHDDILLLLLHSSSI